MNDILRFSDKVVIEPNGCWSWQGHHQKSGYGQFYLEGVKTTAHRAAWLLLRGEISPEMQADHKCRNRGCVNPDHLQIVTKADNLASRILVRATCANGHPLQGENIMIEKVHGKIARRCKICRQKNREAP